MKAIDGHIMPNAHTSRPVSAGPSLSEPSAAFQARERCREIMLDLGTLRARQPLTARLVEVLLLQELARSLALVLFELMADSAAEPEPSRRRRQDREEEAVA